MLQRDGGANPNRRRGAAVAGYLGSGEVEEGGRMTAAATGILLAPVASTEVAGSVFPLLLLAPAKWRRPRATPVELGGVAVLE